MEATNLKVINSRPNLAAYLCQLYQRRFFIFAEAKAKSFSSERKLTLGYIWLILNPLLDVAVYGIIFGLMLRTSRGIEDFLMFLFIGITFFSFISRAFNGGCGIIKVNKNIIKAFPFPRASLILSYSLKNFLESLPPIAVIFAILLFYPGENGPKLTWFVFPFVYLLQVIFMVGLTFFAAWLTDRFPDARAIISYGTRLWFYGSGVFYSIDHFVSDPDLLRILKLNPGYLCLELARDTLLYGKLPNLSEVGLMGAWAVTVLVTGFVLFWKDEVRYSRA